ncbi:MAG: lamin tail domain-containing protein [Syntrophomonadaceae bacterium]|nr:lamin tail domain-containing protein [Syntrophomonadaceae bacterium]
MSRKIVIRAISNSPGGKDPNFKLTDEWVCISNQGTTTEKLANWILLNRKPDNKHYYHFHFPAMLGSRTVELKPGQSVFVITGPGEDVFLPGDENSPGQFFFYRGFDKFIWNEPGDKALLYSYVRQGADKEAFELVAQKVITE